MTLRPTAGTTIGLAFLGKLLYVSRPDGTHPFHSRRDAMGEHSGRHGPRRDGVVSSIAAACSWGALVASAAMLAAVVLAPRMLAVAELDDVFAANQRRLVELERSTAELETTVRALKADPRFAAQLRGLLNTPPHLRTGVLPAALNPSRPAVDAPSRAATPWRLPRPALKALAEGDRLRAILLATAAVLTVASSVGFQGRTLRRASRMVRRAAGSLTRIAGRYRKPQSAPPANGPSRTAA